MIVMDRDGNLFDERRKNKDRRKKNSSVSNDRRVTKDRRVENINEIKRKRK